MDFFDAILELEEYISNTTEPVRDIVPETQAVTPPPVVTKKRSVPPIRISVRSLFRRKYRPVQKREDTLIRTVLRRGYYREKYDRHQRYHALVRRHLLHGGDPNFIYGVNTPEILRSYEEQNDGTYLLFTCIKDLPTFRLLLFCGVDISVSDKSGRKLESLFLNKDVRRFVREHRIFEQRELHFVLYHIPRSYKTGSLPMNLLTTNNKLEEEPEEVMIYEGGTYRGNLFDDLSDISHVILA